MVTHFVPLISPLGGRNEVAKDAEEWDSDEDRIMPEGNKFLHSWTHRHSLTFHGCYPKTVTT